MASVVDQHQNRDVLLGIKRALDEKTAAHSESEGAVRRTQLISLATEPIAAQIEKLGSPDAWYQQYRDFVIPNEKVDQIVALKGLQQWLRKQRSQSEQALSRTVRFTDFPVSKRLQYDEGLRRFGEPSLWDKCFVRMYTAAEWAVEEWAREADLECVDLNAVDPYGAQDYRIGGRDVDVKTTISIGRSRRRECKSYWSPDNLPDTGEIICAVRSTADSSDELTSRHYIQGIFDPFIYRNIPVGLEYFTVDRNLLNACYFHPLEIFFELGQLGPEVPPLGPDVIDYCVDNKKCLAAIFHLPLQDASALLRKALPPCHQDFVPVVAELMNLGKRHLLPHYLADYLLEKIRCKESVDATAVKQVLCSIFEPSLDQKTYLRSLMQASRILPSVRCAHHRNEGIEDIKITVGERGKLILRAHCPTDPALFTTFLAYSRITGETLVYGDVGISVCDAPRCGCLTHLHDGETIGRSSCSRYGDRRSLN